MCCNISLMQDVKTLLTPLTVQFPNGESAVVTHTGSVYLHHISVLISEVLLVTSFTFNLQSVNKFSSQLSSTIHFTSLHVICRTNTGRRHWFLVTLVEVFINFSTTRLLSNISLLRLPQPNPFSTNVVGHISTSILSKIHVSDLHCSSCTS